MVDECEERMRRPTRGLSHLLVVDDDAALLEALSGTLEARLGHLELDTCDSGAKALDLLGRQRYDTIIVDVNMPNMNGFQFLTVVKQLQPATPVIMITGHADGTMMAKAFEGGVADFIPKPFDREELVHAVRRGLELARMQSFAVKLEERHRNALEKVGAIRHDLRQHAVRRLTSKDYPAG